MTREPNKSSLTTSNYNRSSLLGSMAKSKKKEVKMSDGIQISGTADENFTYSFADLDEPGFGRGEIATSYTVEGLHFDNDPELREKYPALKDAWDHYNNVRHMCEQKEKEDED